MDDGGGLGIVERARVLAAAGDWQEAFALFMEADAEGGLAAPDLRVLGEVAYAAGHLDATIEAWERAHSASMQVGDEVAAAAAAVRVAMYLLFDTALMAPVRGWLARAERLLDGRGETPAHAWFAVVRTYERLLTGDTPDARRWARRAVEVGSTWDASTTTSSRRTPSATPSGRRRPVPNATSSFESSRAPSAWVAVSDGPRPLPSALEPL
jgi:hypothetical protein